MLKSHRVGATLVPNTNTAIVSNSQENWDLLNGSGIYFTVSEEGMYDMEIETSASEQITQLVDLLNEKSSNP